jgi:hypothetical protein
MQSVYSPRKQSGLDFVRERVDPDGESAERKAFEQQWLANLGLYAGIKFVADGGVIRPIRDPQLNREAYNAPLILPKVLRFLAKKAAVNPRVTVLPRSDQWEDMQASKLATMAHQHGVDVSRFKQAHQRAERWAAICGSGFVKVCWDPDAGEPDRIYHENGRVNVLAMYDPAMRAEFERRSLFSDVYPGELAAHLVEPWQLWPDPNARDGGIDDCEWVCIRTARSVESVYRETGKRLAPDATAMRGAEQYREIIAFMAGGQAGVNPTVHRSRMAECVFQDEMFVRPNRDYPKGRYIRIAGTEVLDDRDNPYVAAGCPIPIAKVDCIPCPGRFWGISLVDALRNPQRAYNASRGHSMNLQATAGHAPLLLDKGSGIQPRSFKGVPGLVLELNANTRPPMWGQPPQLPPYIGQNAEVALREMAMISAETDPASSKLPGQLRSGDAIRAVQADQNLILSASVESTFDFIEKTGTMMLQLIGLYYDSPRLMNVLGPGNEIDPRYLQGADLRRHYRLKVLAQPGDLDSAESRDAKIMDAAQLLILNPQNPEDRLLMLKGLRFHTSDDYVNALLSQENSEERAIASIVESGGQVVPQVELWFDLELRAKLLERKLNSRAFELYHPAVQEQLRARWMQFTMLRQQQIAAAMQAAQLQNGAPRQPGVASQPAR